MKWLTNGIFKLLTLLQQLDQNQPLIQPNCLPSSCWVNCWELRTMRVLFMFAMIPAAASVDKHNIMGLPLSLGSDPSH